MEINGNKIADFIGASIKKEIKAKHRPKLVTFLVGDSAEQLSFVKIKAQIAKKLGIEFELIHFKTVPSFEKLVHLIKEKSNDPQTTGIIIQQPLPAQLSTDSIYDYIDEFKEIEGHRHKTPYLPPIGLAVLTLLKYIYGVQKVDKNVMINFKKDRVFFKKILRNKKVVLVGRGITGGKPIGKTLTEVKINYIGVNSKTPESELYYKDADIIITAAGKKVLTPEIIKPGAILINIGIRKEQGRLVGDFNEKEIENIASFYTPTPGGIGPIDVMYLYRNLVDAVRLQKK
ncbi:MAG: bifunctional 5,10-methylenetetrahydrofolate dehydrogenase/5,10-methenyltetrahydrofolate cyclohydrolase [bacterium]|nr:bifunctional 5,10-methylenetetrahydrofolate dehydrogenase/5,10-methenyltetrahydrofolate cyclohydrolase [bacterium]